MDVEALQMRTHMTHKTARRLAKPRKKIIPDDYQEPVMPPQAIPDPALVKDFGLPLTKAQVLVVSAAMGVLARSRRPRLTWHGILLLGEALDIGVAHAVKEGGRMHHNPNYNRALAPFLNRTG